jgi:hypothetical protein
MTAPALSQHVRGKGRHYRRPGSDDLVPSVTNIIGVLDKPGIPRWAAKVVAEQAWKLRHSLDGLGQDEAVDVLKGSPWRSSGRSADRGTSVHAYLEAHANGHTPPELSGEAARFRAAADEFLDLFQPEFVETEFTVFGDGYAGTADFLAVVDGRMLVGDYKTSKRLYPEVALQLAAIRHAEVVVRPDGTSVPMPDTDGALGVLLTPKGCEVREVDAGAGTFGAFLACRDAWLWRKSAWPLGPTLSPREVTA